ncbi:testis-expressed protein 9 [Eurytemora carolleeae]|uniref:testis-expressed protein 9 n=1 Tax=Eurytemora carolleeae TaxID=1294199 RepID=UPI000C779295|nr:testis-expressed protein 9 [Eurytemora carolleeae]|eukprot:XP_023331096.1 testis-expressed protein 9-like [Eurytemora affinis]
MDELLTREKELLKLNAELDSKHASVEPKKKGATKCRLSKPRNSRPTSKTREAEIQGSENKEEDNFIWAPLPVTLPDPFTPSAGGNTYVWAPIPQEAPRTEEVNHKGKKKKNNKRLEPRIEEISIQEEQEELQENQKEESWDLREVPSKISLDHQTFPEEKLIGKVDQTQVKILNLKLRSYETQLDRMRDEYTELAAAKENLEKDNRNIEEQRRRTESQNRGLTSQLEKLRGEIVDLRHRVGTTEDENILLRKEVEEAKKEIKKNVSKKTTSDVRLNRALEDSNRLRGELQAAEREKKEAKEGGRKAVEDLTIKNKFLEKQRNELLQGFKKQMELIDVLKRQKLHLEAAHVLKYTEDEFMETLDWKPTSANGTEVN